MGVSTDTATMKISVETAILNKLQLELIPSSNIIPGDVPKGFMPYLITETLIQLSLSLLYTQQLGIGTTTEKLIYE